MTRKITSMISTFTILIAGLLLGGCNTIELRSKWAKPSSPDNINAEISQGINYFDEDSKVRVSILNNNDTLYVQLVTREQKTKMLFLRTGFTVWIDSSGEARKDFGLLFPMPKTHSVPRSPDHNSQWSIKNIIEDSQYNLAILNGITGNHQTITVAKAADQGIHVRLRTEYGYLIYELSFPLSQIHTQHIISMGFESGSMKMAAGRGGTGSGQGGGKGSGKAGGGKGKRGMSGGQRGEGQGGVPPEPINIWAQVRLANSSSDQ